MLPDVHYNDALLTLLFASGLSFMIWSIKQFARLTAQIFKLEKRLTKKIDKSNKEGARLVMKQFDQLMNGKDHHQ